MTTKRQTVSFRALFALVSLTLLSAPALAQPLTITHFAGVNGGAGSVDGTGSGARFIGPGGVAADGSGNLYVADGTTIRMIVVATGEVSTLAGLAGTSGSADGRGSTARFNGANGVAFDGTGNLYVADSGNHTIRKVVVATGEVSTLAGLAGHPGHADGTGSTARFYGPAGVAADGFGNVYVAEATVGMIRKIVVATGAVTTLADQAAQFSYPCGVAADGAGNVFVADTQNHTIRKIVVATGEVSILAGLTGSEGWADGTGSAARFDQPYGIAADGAGNLFVADTSNRTIRKIVVATGQVTTFAGTAFNIGSADGVGKAAQFWGPHGVAADGTGNLYVADGSAHTIRKIVVATRSVTTLAGQAISAGSADGTGSAARFRSPTAITADGQGNLYVADTGNDMIRKIVAATRAVTTVVGPPTRIYSHGVAADSSGNLYATDSLNHTILKIVLATGEVTTLAGLAGKSGSTDGIGSTARFSYPWGIAADGMGNLYVTEIENDTIRRIVAATGEVTTLAGLAGSVGSTDGAGSAARFNNPMGVAADGSGNVYVCDQGNWTIRRILAATGVVTTIAGLAGRSGGQDGTGSAARFTDPRGIAVGGSGDLYVADSGGSSIRQIVLATGAVTTVAGNWGFPGYVDGTGSAARFQSPEGVAVDKTGKVYIADTNNDCIRMGTVGPGLADAAMIDASSGPVGQVRQFDTSPRTATRWLWEEVRRPPGSAATLSSATIRNPTFTPDVPDLYVFRLTASDDSGAQSITTVSLMVTVPTAGSVVTRLLPIVIDVSSGAIHYTSEMTLTNNTSGRLSVSLLYTASLGSKQGSGTVTDSLAPGEQKKVGDVLSYLRDKSLSIPSSQDQPSQGGTLLVTFQSSDTIDPRLVSATARTAALTTAPQPLGRAGLAYSGFLATESSTSSLTLYGLRSTPTDRTNVAVFNTSDDAVTLKVTVCSGTGDGRCIVYRAAETLAPYGWLQYGSSQILDGTGISKGWVTVEKISTTGSFGAYAVINDFATNDGSFVLPVGGAVSGSTLTVPVLSETPVFRSELILANRSASNVTLTLDYVESQSPSSGPGGTITVQLGPKEEQIIPEALDFLRTNGVNIGARDKAPYVGALRITVSGTSIENVFAGARTASQSPAGGQFGLFTPCVYSGQEASSEAYLYGLRADPENRSNVAVVNTGDDAAGPILLQLQAYDGDAGAAPKGNPVSVTLSPGQWAQPGNFFKNSGVVNGWVKVTRMSGTAPWLAYGVVNDGGSPGERTGDGAYVPMTQ